MPQAPSPLASGRPHLGPRDMPREVQEIAFEKGMVPYVPAERE